MLSAHFPSQIGYYNGDSEDKQNILDYWFNGTIPIIIVTRSSFGLGINNPNVNFIIHLGLSPSPLDYFIQCSRLNRDHKSDKEKKCIMSYNEQDFLPLQFSGWSPNKYEKKKVEHQNLKLMKKYCDDYMKAKELFRQFIEGPFFHEA